MKILHLKNIPIYEQLLLEEALLRDRSDNWCLINEGSSKAIVMGISGKVDELVDRKKAKLANVPIIKRFSGGGTVIVDEETLFITFIFQKEEHPFPAYPEPILRWSEEIYKEAFEIPGFALRENDFVIGEKKCGGNAQYIKKGRWLHHTSFLWDFKKENMELLLHPKKAPEYRKGRSHDEFLTKLCHHAPSKESLALRLKAYLQKKYRAEEHTFQNHPLPSSKRTVVLE